MVQIFGFCFMVSIRKDVAVGVKLEEGTEAGVWCWISSAVREGNSVNYYSSCLV
jgi:hypothetical protein